MRNNFLTLVFGVSTVLFGLQKTQAQNGENSCGTETPSQEWENQLQELIVKFKNDQQTQKSQSTTYTIPVIFHVIHGGEAVGTYPNILAGQINSQIAVLNQDFAGTGFHSGNYPPNAFANWAINQALPSANLDSAGRVKIANTGITFCLATQDTSGNLLAEPGIERINYISKGWTNPNTFTNTNTFKAYLDGTIKPQSIWDVTKYLNIWITDRNAVFNAAGVSTVPPFSGLADIPNTATDSTDGIWCYTKVVGSNTLFPAGIYISPIVEGRTLTHEAGHYLGLRHIWNDTNCGNDYCNDTPTATTASSAPVTYPYGAGTCASPSNAPDGIMFMNFMDYGSDLERYMFTVDQTTRMQTAMLNSPFRNQLGTHNLCASSTGLYESSTSIPLLIYPNPANEKVVISCSGNLKQVQVFNLTGALVLESYCREFSVAQLEPGMYLVIAETGKTRLTGKIIIQ